MAYSTERVSRITVTLIVLISSMGIRLMDLPLLPNQIATVGVVASAPFSYVSAEKTRSDREEHLKSLPPVYRLDFAPLHRFEEAVRDLQARLAALDVEIDAALVRWESLEAKS